MSFHYKHRSWLWPRSVSFRAVESYGFRHLLALTWRFCEKTHWRLDLLLFTISLLSYLGNRREKKWMEDIIEQRAAKTGYLFIRERGRERNNSGVGPCHSPGCWSPVSLCGSPDAVRKRFTWDVALNKVALGQVFSVSVSAHPCHHSTDAASSLTYQQLEALRQ